MHRLLYPLPQMLALGHIKTTVDEECAQQGIPPVSPTGQ